MKVVYEPGEIASIEKSVEILNDNGLKRTIRIDFTD